MSGTEPTRGLAGSWLLTGDARRGPIAAGAVVLDAGERIVRVGAAARLRRQYSKAAWQQHAAVLLPGLVNAHVHLELSALKGRVTGGRGFVPWLRELLAARQAVSERERSNAIRAQVRSLSDYGTVAVGEVTNSLAAVPFLAKAPLLGRVFHEIYGLGSAAASAALARARTQFQDIRDWPANLSWCLAPHALYSVPPSTVEAIVAEARERGVVTSLHLAEHPAERAFLADGAGPFSELMRRQGREQDWLPPHMGPVQYATELGALNPGVLAVHLTDASAAELGSVAKARAPVVLCPRSNLYIEGRLPNLAALLRAGVEPGLGSDSLASNTNLDVLAEAATLQGRFPRLSARTCIAMATSFGAQALGLGASLGRLARGMRPGVLAIAHGPTPPDDPERFVLTELERPRKLLAGPPRRIAAATAATSKTTTRRRA